MQFLKRLASLFTGRPAGNGQFLTIYVLSHRCREPISTEVNLLNELSQTDEDDAAFFTRKVLHGSGRNRCFARAEVLLWLDRNKQVLRYEVHGGRWLSEEEYLEELERFNTPPAEEDEEVEGSEDDGAAVEKDQNENLQGP
jgi:hypothetical protein